MGLFDRIFKPGAQDQRQWTKRSPRVKVLPLHRVSFSFTDPVALGAQLVVNLSLEGVAFARDASTRWPEQGAVLSGAITVREEHYPISIELRFLGERLVGGKFKDVPQTFKERLLTHFFAEFAAAKVTQVKPELLQEDPDGKPHFFLGENGCELYFVENAGQVVHYHMAFFGNYIEGDKEGCTRVGILEDESAAEDKPGYKGSTIVRGGQSLSRDLALVATKFLSNVMGLDSGIREAITARITQAAQD